MPAIAATSANLARSAATASAAICQARRASLSCSPCTGHCARGTSSASSCSERTRAASARTARSGKCSVSRCVANASAIVSSLPRTGRSNSRITAWPSSCSTTCSATSRAKAETGTSAAAVAAAPAPRPSGETASPASAARSASGTAWPGIAACAQLTWRQCSTSAPSCLRSIRKRSAAACSRPSPVAWAATACARNGATSASSMPPPRTRAFDRMSFITPGRPRSTRQTGGGGTGRAAAAVVSAGCCCCCAGAAAAAASRNIEQVRIVRMLRCLWFRCAQPRTRPGSNCSDGARMVFANREERFMARSGSRRGGR